ncbi:MAG: Xaa-Pro aminopeptidase [Proteobacteria bacterium SG_bin7]|nr:MAG: Xaa-Pro aminopeptidase [Proteobacteria bacterium SG_bin7]
MRNSLVDPKVLKKRRQKLGEATPGSAIVIPAHPEFIRNNDVHHAYRQDSNMFYFSGFEEPESVMVFRPGLDPEYILFVREKNVERETWDGFRFGPDMAASVFGADRAYPVNDFDRVMVDLLEPVEKIYYRLNWNHEFDSRLFRVLDSLKQKRGRSGRGYPPIFDTTEILGDIRLFKTPEEIPLIKKACEISSEAHVAMMKAVRPGVNEREIYGKFLSEIMKRGADREAYGAIVASGANATVLHYRFNDQELKKGELILIDAGAEYQYYAGDITRTFPVNAKFSKAQKEVYEAVLNIQKKMIELVKPGIPQKNMQEECIKLVVQTLLDLGFLSGKASENIENKSYQKYYMHGVSHWLGMDVHDAGVYQYKGESRKLEPNMLFTIEPGIYIPLNDTKVPSDYRGIGVRIEDDVLVTNMGAEVLTTGAPKEVSDLEALIGKGN